jgi:DNA-binding response OmpR family regulator
MTIPGDRLRLVTGRFLTDDLTSVCNLRFQPYEKLNFSRLIIALMKKKILVIDDSKAIRFLLQSVLGKTFDVITASDGRSGMHHLYKRNLPDLIIADPQLPDMQDWELIEYLASSRLYGNIPLAVLSSFDKNDTTEKVRELGLKNYFLKPFNPLELSKSVTSLLLNGVSLPENSLKFA